jgi:hypothetical protein
VVRLFCSSRCQEISNTNESKEHSMQSEALNTQHRQSSWTSDQRLRHTKVNFISAGGSEPLKSTEPETSLAEMSLNDLPTNLSGTAGREGKAPASQDDNLSARHTQAFTSTLDDVTEVADPFVIDTLGDESIFTGLSPPRIRSISPAPSSSSEEVILFRGRDQNGRAKARQVRDPFQNHKRAVQEQQAPLHDPLASGELLSQSRPDTEALPQENRRDRSFAEPIKPSQNTASDTTKSGDGNGDAKRRNRSRRNKLANQIDQALIDDYINNMDAHESDSDMLYNQRDLGGDVQSDVWQETDASFADTSHKRPDFEWNNSELSEFGDLSASEEKFESVKTVLSKRKRKSGLQYLVVWEGLAMGGARWVPISGLTDAKTLALIKEFDAENRLVAEGSENKGANCDKESANELTDDEDIDSLDDNEDLLQRNIDRMTDEKIAQLFAKQEELGMGSAELMLFDELPEVENDGRDVVFRLAQSASRHWLKSRPVTKRAKGGYPAASALADAYDGFDVMDFERPSLKKKPRGRKGKLVFDLSDSELEASMEMAWENDRSKKRIRKEERQERRMQGLLGRKDNKPDLKSKYREGMSIHAVRGEIKNFLIGDNTT